MDIKPIKNEVDYEATLAEVDKLLNAEPDTPEYDRLDVLTTLIEAYEEKVHSIETPDPIEAIKHALEAYGLSERELDPILGSRSRTWEIMNRQRTLSLKMIRGLHEKLNIPAEALIQPYEKNRGAA